MRAPVSWIREYVDLPDGLSTEDLAAKLTALGLKLESLTYPGADVTGPLVVGKVLTKEPEPQKNGKTINWCTVDVGDANGTGEPQGIVCGAHNFEPGDLVVVVLPGAVLPGGFEISARKTYGHVSAGMICSARELGLGDDHTGIIVLPPDAGQPGESVREYLHLDDEVIEFEINPDRAYALSLRGVAREAALGFDAPYTDPAARDVPEPNADGYPVLVEDPEGCPVFVARTVTGFDPAAPTPRWMARRIQLAGMRPISLAVDVTNYVMLELGHPIHGYDLDRLQGPIRVRRATEGEHLTTLDDADRVLSAQDLVVTDDSGPIGLGGVMGGATTEMSGSTTRILVEVASWDPVSMFRTGKRHKLTSEAGKRNERGVDPTIPEAAADRVVELLVQYGGAVADPGVTKVGEPPASPSIRIAASLPARVTGMEIGADTVAENLTAVGCSVDGTEDLVVVPPPWRRDITDPFDLVEEVARIVGYDNVPSVLPPAPAGRGLTFTQQLRRRVGRTLAGAGYVEVLTFPFVGTEAFDSLELAEDDPRRFALRLANPLSAEAPLMTTTLLPGILETVARNTGRGNDDLALFEVATVTLPHGGPAAPILGVDRRPSDGEWDDLNKALPDQPLHLVLALAGDREPSGWWGAGRPVAWSDPIDSIREVAAALGVEVDVRTGKQAPWHPGRCAELFVGEVSLGYAGELHPRVCQALGVPARTAIAEIDLTALLAHAVAVVPAPEFSTYPVAKEDVALVVGADVPAEEVGRALREGAGALCESVRLFDVYRGEQIGEGRKSLAFALRFRAPDRTLTEAETGAARDAAVAVAVERFGAEQRA
ncbi:MAG: phenylalanine--tRNA ligase subunit beta [Nocardioidaceae bacterium]|nr:phenylalanine--tRNA ligase subunit beta [Nocardioidaceae bacterium]